MATQVRQRGAVSEFFTGTGLLFRGLGLVGRNPRLLLLGLLPGVIALVVVVAAFVLLVYFVADVAAIETWFASGWSADARAAVRILAEVATIGVAVIVAVVTFTAVTITIGDPFYETISKRVDDTYGGATEAAVPWYRTLRWNLVDSVRLLLASLLTSVLLFLVGVVPVVGQTVAPVLGAAVGGWLLAVEISGVPFNRRGMRLRERRRLLRANRALALGFGVPIFLAFLVPFVAVLLMPGAVAGATLLTRRILGQRYE